MNPETAKDALIAAGADGYEQFACSEDSAEMFGDEWDRHAARAVLDALLEHREELLIAMGGTRQFAYAFLQGVEAWEFPRVSESVPQKETR